MQKQFLTSAVLATLSGFATVAHADITHSFTGLTFGGFQFMQLAGPVYGTLTSVSVDATLDASTAFTYADDLTIYVDPLPLTTGGLLQVGGYSSTSAAERHFWANGASSLPGTTVVDTVVLLTPLAFTGAASDPAIWLGNGYSSSTTSGTWTGSITLGGLSVTPVPEPSSWALLGAGGIGLMGWVGRRRRRSVDTV